MPPDPVEDTAERIRRRAYELWKAAGCPNGRSDEFWEQASVEIGNEIMREDKPSMTAAEEIRAA